jgi:hypothetical protein
MASLGTLVPVQSRSHNVNITPIITTLGDDVVEDFQIMARRAIPSLTIMVVLGVLAALAGVVSGLSRGVGPLDRPIALLFLTLSIPTIWVVTLGVLATFSIRITSDSVEKRLWRRWIVASKPLSQLASARVDQNTLKLRFTDGSTMRLAAMPLRDPPRLAALLKRRCPNCADRITL